MDNLKEEIALKIKKNYEIAEQEDKIIEEVLASDLNFKRINTILNFIIDGKLGKDSAVAFLYYQLFKIFPQSAEALSENLTDDERSMVEDFKTIRDINQLTLSEEIDDIKRMFIVMGKDMRVVIIKLAGIYYDISILERPLSVTQKNFVRQVKDIHVPLAERLGLDKLKQNLYDNVVRLEYPQEYYKLKLAIESKKETPVIMASIFLWPNRFHKMGQTKTAAIPSASPAATFLG